jgi:hypothetical protein
MQAVGVPVAQFRTRYLLAVPTNYATTFVNVTAPTGSTIVLDGKAIPSRNFRAVGASGMSVAVQALSLGDGAADWHQLTSDKPFGVLIYGFAPYTGYMVPGGIGVDPGAQSTAH